jgi:superfamily II DNA helicase RecQ
MRKLGIKAVSVTQVEAATDEGRDLFKEIRECKWEPVFISAERLTSPEVERILDDIIFCKSLILLGVDKAHVLVPWAGCAISESIPPVAILRRRLPHRCAFAAVSATLTSAGLDDLRRELGLRSPNFRCIRLSVQRPNVCTTITELTHSSNGD